MIKRNRPPRIAPIRAIDTPQVEVLHLDNGVPLYFSDMGTQEVLRIEAVFRAGRPYETKQLAAMATASQIREGSKTRASAEIAETFDYYGCEFSSPFHMDTANFSLVALNKHLGAVLPLMGEILSEPAFPEKELDHFIKRNQQKLLVDLSQNDVIAYRHITEKIFGANHPYGYNSLPEMYTALEVADLHRHFERTFTTGNCLLFASGHVRQEAITQINRYLGQAIRKGPAVPPSFSIQETVPEKARISRPKTLQTAIRIGRRLFPRTHPDFPGMYVANAVLGGYFGSRLMSSIREEKGYTYSIYSSLETLCFDGFFYIATETGNDVVQETLDLIYQEIQSLQDRLISVKELNMAKSYLMGAFLTDVDGPFNTMDLVRSLAGDQLPVSFFQDTVRAVQEITPEEIRSLAQRYFSREAFWETIVGP